MFGLGKAVLGGLTGSQGNPLKGKEAKRTGYEGMNRDSGEPYICSKVYAYGQMLTSAALQVLDTMMSTPSTSTSPRSFVYISAADCFRPLIPSKYIETKRQAEFGITRKVLENPEKHIVPAFIRPGTYRDRYAEHEPQADANRPDVSSPYPTNLDLARFRLIPIRIDS